MNRCVDCGDHVSMLADYDEVRCDVCKESRREQLEDDVDNMLERILEDMAERDERGESWRVADTPASEEARQAWKEIILDVLDPQMSAD